VGGNASACHEQPDQPEFKSADIVVFGPSLSMCWWDAMMELMGRKAQCRCAWDNQYCITGAHTHTHTHTHERCWRQSSGTRRLFNHSTGTHRHDSLHCM